MTGLSAKLQRRLKKEVRKARHMGMLPVLSRYAPNSIEQDVKGQAISNHLNPAFITGTDEWVAMMTHNMNVAKQKSLDKNLVRMQMVKDQMENSGKAWTGNFKDLQAWEKEQFEAEELLAQAKLEEGKKTEVVDKAN